MDKYIYYVKIDDNMTTQKAKEYMEEQRKALEEFVGPNSKVFAVPSKIGSIEKLQ